MAQRLPVYAELQARNKDTAHKHHARGTAQSRGQRGAGYAHARERPSAIDEQEVDKDIQQIHADTVKQKVTPNAVGVTLFMCAL